MRKISVEKLVQGLRAISEEKFCVKNVYNFLDENPVAPNSLSPYAFFSKNCYTRNLIFKNQLFEILAVCWQSGQTSLIHDHANENCWMTMPVGRLRVQNFRVVEQDLTMRFCQLEPTDFFDLTNACAAEVQPEEPLHQVLNPKEFDQPAISLHVYSRPFDRCNVYSLQKNEVIERKMSYTSVYGKLCEGVRL